MRRGSKRNGACGFSLVEVVLAAGIVGVVIVPLISLMAIGLRTHKASSAETRGALIAQKIIAENQMMPFDKISGSDHFVDFEGNEVPQENAVFRATVLIEKDPPNGIVRSGNIARVSVLLSGPALQNHTNTFSSLVVNRGF